MTTVVEYTDAHPATCCWQCRSGVWLCHNLRILSDIPLVHQHLWSSSHSSAVCTGSLPQQTRVMGLLQGRPAPLEAPLAQPGVPALLAPLLAAPLLQTQTMTATGSAACRRSVFESVTLLLSLVNTLLLSVPKARVCRCCPSKFAPCVPCVLAVQSRDMLRLAALKTRAHLILELRHPRNFSCLCVCVFQCQY